MKYITENNKTCILNEEGNQIAVLEHPENKSGIVNFVHTEVDPFYTGQGLASKLTEYVAEQMRIQDKKVELSCSYSIRWFDKHKEYSDVLLDPEAERCKAKNIGGPACGINRNK